MNELQQEVDPRQDIRPYREEAEDLVVTRLHVHRQLNDERDHRERAKSEKAIE